MYNSLIRWSTCRRFPSYSNHVIVVPSVALKVDRDHIGKQDKQVPGSDCIWVVSLTGIDPILSAFSSRAFLLASLSIWCNLLVARILYRRNEGRILGTSPEEEMWWGEALAVELFSLSSPFLSLIIFIHVAFPTCRKLRSPFAICKPQALVFTGGSRPITNEQNKDNRT